jgi:acyl dehydratase
VAALAHAVRGISHAARQPRLVLLLWLANLALAAIVALPVGIALAKALPRAPAADALRDGFDVGIAAEIARDDPGLARSVQAAFGAAAFVALLVAPFLAAGTVETLSSRDDRPFAHRFGRGAGHFGGRFLRAGLAALPLAALGAALLGGPLFALRHRLEDTASFETRSLLGLAGAAGAGLGLLVALLALDYARLDIARRDSRQPMRLVWRGLRFVLRHPFATLGLWAANALVVVLGVALYLALRSALPAASWPAILIMVVAQQMVALARAGLRVALWSGERALLDEVAPLPAPTPEPPTMPRPAVPESSEGSSPMNLEVGQTASRSATFTPEHVELYAQISGDRNPLHFDPEWVAKTRFGRLLVQGGLTTGLLHALVAMDLPGPGTVFLSQNWKFTAPVYIGDTVTAEARVVSVHPQKPVVQLAVKAVRQDGETVLEGEAWCYTARPD